ncbi:hypothetical protein KQH58_17020, partial [Mycetohabitans sp. B6]|nr:hypothetical protein [Mycetohabitans sp. B6]
VWFNVPIQLVIVLFGTFVCLTMWCVMRRHAANQRAFDQKRTVGERRKELRRHDGVKTFLHLMLSLIPLSAAAV